MLDLPLWVECLFAAWATTLVAPFISVLLDLQGHGIFKAMWPLLIPFYVPFLVAVTIAHLVEIAPTVPSRLRKKLHLLR